jgi:hypothetical protein
MTDPVLPRVLICHPGASWSTADVYNGLRFGLSALNVQTAAYQLDVRIARSAQWLHWNWKKSGANPDNKPNPRDAQYHAASGILERAMRIQPDWILIVSGMYLDIDIVRFLRKAGFKIAILLTESPYDDLKQAEFIRNAEVVWTNERSSVDRLRAVPPLPDGPRTRVRYLAHAWHPLVHVAQPPADATPRYDALFVGTGFPERVELLKAVRWPDADKVALYGHWDTLGGRSKLRRILRGGVLSNEEAAELYRGATVNLNLMRRRIGHATSAEDAGADVIAESVNPRCMELAAMGRFFVSDSRPELRDLFGDLVPTFETAEELSALLEEWLHPAADVQRVGYGQELTRLAAGHSWVDRARVVLNDLTASPTTVVVDWDAQTAPV